MYRCHVCLSIPTNPDYGSLNLAQAVQLLSYDWRQALGGFGVTPRTRDPRLASVDMVQGALGALGRGAGPHRFHGPGRAAQAVAKV